MTPEAVIYRYLEAASAQPPDIERLQLVLSADADLLGRWLNVLDCPADPDVFSRHLRNISSARLRQIAQVQAWAVLPVSGSARLGLDQWQSVLRSAFLAEVLAEQVGIADPQIVRWRILLAVSGVNLLQDRALQELVDFRGIRAELLEDAGIEIRILAVVDAFEVLDEYRAGQLAQRLLQISSENFADLVDWAATRCAELMNQLGLNREDDEDWSNRLWVQRQVSMLADLLRMGRTPAEVRDAHEFATRSLFRQVPLLLLQDHNRLRVAAGGDIEIQVDSPVSTIAAATRSGEIRTLSDSSDLAVGDRQLLRRIGTDGALCLPLRHGDRSLGALLFGVDDDVDHEFALKLYADQLAQRLAELAGRGSEEQELLKRYRQREEKRLRELVHEANNPLSVVHNYLHILEMRLQHEPSATEQLQMIGSELKRAGEIIQRARDVPPITDAESQPDVVIEPFDLNDLVRRVHELHRGYAADHTVRTTMDLPPGTVRVDSDEQRLAQILNNLMRNAIEAATGESVEIGVTSGVFREGREGVELYVRDTGPGLPRSVLDRLADPKESSKGGSHAGLGLHIVHRLVQELGGSIDVRTAPGRGTTFSLYLPLRVR
ncbi:MAG: HAMP domain-containing sensor histidine kinase [Pseudomonadales bacterium]|nr:HAMP domain-containing histidine kinase [Pseudomonadales bacterium]